MCLLLSYMLSFFFFFKQKTAYEMRISDWSSDVCSSDLSACEPFSISAAASRARRRLRQGRANAGKIARRRARLLRARWLRKGHDAPDRDKIGRASCRERVCQYV